VTLIYHTQQTSVCSCRQETEALVHVYQKLVTRNLNVATGQATGSGTGTVGATCGIAPTNVCEVR